MNQWLENAIKLIGVSTFLAVGTANADGYWMATDGSPLRTADGSCIKSSAWTSTPPVAGCDPISKPVRISKPARIVLLPDPNGKVGAVLVKNPSGEQTLNEAYAGLQAPVGSALQRSSESEASVKARYGQVLDARPPRPVTFVVRFENGSATQLTAESLEVVAQLKTALAKWPAPQLAIVGHTDRVGNAQSNDALSLKRAQTVSQQLIRLGIPSSSLETAGRGEQEPLVATEDGVANAANRRVEITLR
jgi:OmpA-OmpF porin, OOP family